ncbi:DUF6894 family protein [Lichenibacterium dinghuense]|uniref:DUF6894 family protein n=1 Tax=Lichenibacterium dinghuense TaxID=2895977 RepID=UPI003D1735CF
MPQYFFDTDRGDRICRDGRGLELSDDDAARHEAKKHLFDLFYGVPSLGRTIVACVVRDGLGCVVYRVMMTVDGEGEPGRTLTRRDRMQAS